MSHIHANIQVQNLIFNELNIAIKNIAIPQLFTRPKQKIMI
jgi:hypothetical protein